MTWWDVLYIPKSALMSMSASPEEVNCTEVWPLWPVLLGSWPVVLLSVLVCFSFFFFFDRVLLNIPGWPQMVSLLGAGFISVYHHPWPSGLLLAWKYPEKVTCAFVFKPPSHVCFSQASLVPGKVMFQFVFKPLFYVDFSYPLLVSYSTAPECSNAVETSTMGRR